MSDLAHHNHNTVAAVAVFSLCAAHCVRPKRENLLKLCPTAFDVEDVLAVRQLEMDHPKREIARLCDARRIHNSNCAVSRCWRKVREFGGRQCVFTLPKATEGVAAMRGEVL